MLAIKGELKQRGFLIKKHFWQWWHAWMIVQVFLSGCNGNLWEDMTNWDFFLWWPARIILVIADVEVIEDITTCQVSVLETENQDQDNIRISFLNQKLTATCMGSWRLFNVSYQETVRKYRVHNLCEMNNIWR